MQTCSSHRLPYAGPPESRPLWTPYTYEKICHIATQFSRCSWNLRTYNLSLLFRLVNILNDCVFSCSHQSDLRDRGPFCSVTCKRLWLPPITYKMSYQAYWSKLQRLVDRRSITDVDLDVRFWAKMSHFTLKPIRKSSNHVHDRNDWEADPRGNSRRSDSDFAMRVNRIQCLYSDPFSSSFYVGLRFEVTDYPSFLL